MCLVSFSHFYIFKSTTVHCLVVLPPLLTILSVLNLENKVVMMKYFVLMSLFLSRLAVVLRVVNIFCYCLCKDEKELQEDDASVQAVVDLHTDDSIPSAWHRPTEANTH